MYLALTEGCCCGICRMVAGYGLFQYCLQDRNKTGSLKRGPPRLSCATILSILTQGTHTKSSSKQRRWLSATERLHRKLECNCIHEPHEGRRECVCSLG